MWEKMLRTDRQLFLSDPPVFSIVMPNLNGGRFLAEALESILSQDFSSLELIVVDGGSTDCSAEVFERFRDRINVLIVEPDQGQADAILMALPLPAESCSIGSTRTMYCYREPSRRWPTGSGTPIASQARCRR